MTETPQQIIDDNQATLIFILYNEYVENTIKALAKIEYPQFFINETVQEMLIRTIEIADILCRTFSSSSFLLYQNLFLALKDPTISYLAFTAETTIEIIQKILNLAFRSPQLFTTIPKKAADTRRSFNSIVATNAQQFNNTASGNTNFTNNRNFNNNFNNRNVQQSSNINNNNSRGNRPTEGEGK